MPHPPLILSRFLYCKDEVELSLVTALLKKEELEVIYYWAYELYYSGFDIFEFMWQIYLDFYYEQHPQFEAYFKKKHDLWKLDKDMKHIAYILRNMYNLKATCTVFMMRQYTCKKDYKDMYPTIMYKLKTKDENILYHNLYQNLLLALERRHFENICYYLRVLWEENKTNVGLVIGQFLNIIIKEEDTLHYVLAVISKKIYYQAEENKPVGKHIYVVPKQEQLDHIKQLEEELIQPIYNTLMFKRFAEIDDRIGSFTLARGQWLTTEAFIKEMWFHWEYYAMGSPVWLRRLEKFGGTVNHRQKKIEFATEIGEEGFYDLYAYELDELPKEVQAMSMKPIVKRGGTAWCNYTFPLNVYEGEEEENELWQWTY
uniref:Uncharacterized protein n=1 Tax=viral metagenome TaxID=1070528 RepID=A0A6C0IKD3_9ZZZZ